MSNEKNPKELFDYRVKLFRDAQGWKKPDRTPISANVTHWMFHDAGYSTSYAVRHYDVVEECMVRFVQKYKVDSLNLWMSGFRNFDAVTDHLGSTVYSGNDENLLNLITEEKVSPDEYDAFTQDMMRATWELLFPRAYPEIRNMAPQQFAESVREYCHYLEERARIDSRMRDEFGILVEKHLPVGWSSLETAFSGMRGVKGLAMDLRRCYPKVKAFCEANDPGALEWTLMDIGSESGPDMTEPYDCMISMLPHTILRPKQFEDLIWPVFKPILDHAVQYNKQVINFAEGSWKTFGHYFNEYPKGTICMMVESDDPFEIRKQFPNIAIYGGLDTTVMSKGTPQQCVDMAKRAIDELGWEGGLILAPNKMLAYPNDMNAENLEAVCNFVAEYK